MRRQEGFAAVELVAGIGFLVFPIAVLVISLPIWAETQTSARSVAQEAARAFALAGDDATGRARAVALADRIAENLDIELSAPLDLFGTVEAPPGRPSEVSATVTVRLPLIPLPFFADLTAVDWSVEHREPVDAYRSRP